VIPTKDRGRPATAAPVHNKCSASKSTRQVLCRCHCSSCGGHFASLDAFDAHRRGRFGDPHGSAGGRHCAPVPDLVDDADFESVAGICRIYDEEGPALIWRRAGSADRAAQDLHPEPLAVAA
jgi:hypothetical protein